MMRKKRGLTLLEVVIALSLMGILIGALFSRLHQAIFFQAKLEKAQRESNVRRDVHERLSIIFSAMLPEEEASAFKEKSGLSSDEKMVFYFDNGIDHDGAFQGKVKGELFVEKDLLILRLCGKEKKRRDEILMEGVKKIHLSYFDILSEKKGWIPEWKERAWALPPMIRLKLERVGERDATPLEFAFFISHEDNLILYENPHHPKLGNGVSDPLKKKKEGEK